jgi:ABC-type multidrug transport system ATPase subunit
MRRNKGLDPAAIKSRSKDLFDRLDLQPGPGVAIDSLSKGNRQKVVVAQAFLGPVGLLVLDEPFTGLDPSAHRALDELTREAQAGGTAVLMSAHRPMSEKPGLRQLRIDGGSLGEIERDDATTLRYTYEMMVELAPTLRAHDHGQVTSIPGVASGLLRQPDNILVLRTSDAQIDHVLTAAIALGWSVRSVTPRNPIGRSW